MAKMTRTMWLKDPDGDTVKVVAGDDAPDWYDGRYTDSDEDAASEPQTAAGHPTTGPAAEDDEDVTGDALVQGTVDRVRERVGDDPEKAQRALDAERAGQNRSTLVAALESIVENGAGPDAENEDGE